jgi:hypothetical protein
MEGALGIGLNALSALTGSSMGVAALRTDAGTGLTANAEICLHNRHDFAFDFVLLFVIDKLTLFVHGFEAQHTTTAYFQTATATNALVPINGLNKLRDPGDAATG